MRKEFRNRYTVVGIIFVVAFLGLMIKLFNLQFIHGEKYLADAQDFSRKELRQTGARGKILDSNGLPLAYNKTSYKVQFVRNPSLTGEDARKSYTMAIYNTMKIIEKNGGKFLSTFAIKRGEDGTFDFSWTGIDKDKDKKAYEARVVKWKNENCKSGYIDKTKSPEEIFNQYRAYYSIPDDLSYEEAYKVMSVWQEIRATYYASYLPVTLAENVDMNTVAEIEIHSNELIGMQISQSSTRVYPNKSMAAHIIGYMGRMLDEPQIKSYEDLGYKQNDLVGNSGIEKSEEAELSGNTAERTGTQVVEVDSLGKVIREISSDNKDPKPGNNVMLTIDSGMQKRLEEALAENIAQIKAEQMTTYHEKKEKYDNELAKRKDDKINYASVGAAVVMDVQTGSVLAMASYPSYDLNMFTGGLSTDEFEKIKNDPRNPLFNNAITSRGTPGSIFKMTTGLAGLMENAITLDDKISDGGEYRAHIEDPNEHGPTCWVRPFSKHADETIETALRDSCNYFFFTVADKLGVDKLNKWADLVGLTSKTGIELENEKPGQVGNQNSLYSSGNMSGVAALVRNQIISSMKVECEKQNLKYDDDKYNEVALQIMGLVNQGIQNKGPDIRAILKNEMKLTSGSIVSSGLDSGISALLTEIEWNPNYTIEAGIGQSVTLLTPIGVARYISALVNGGDVFEARLVKSIITPEGDEKPVAPKLIRNLGVPEEYFAAIKRGMHDVVSDEEGSANEFFKDFPEEYKDMIGGKTGTAEVSKTIDLENNSWFVAFAPFDKPEIAVVVYIPHGHKGALSSYTAKEMLKYYLDKKFHKVTEENMPLANTLVN